MNSIMELHNWIMESYNGAASSTLPLLTTDWNKKMNFILLKYLLTTYFFALLFKTHLSQLERKLDSVMDTWLIK